MVERHGELYPFYFKRNKIEITLEYFLWKLWNKCRTLAFSFNSLTVMAFVVYKFFDSIYSYIYKKVEDAPESLNHIGKDQSESKTETAEALIRPFKISVPDEVLSDLQVRLEEARFEEPMQDSGFEYGFNSIYLQKVVQYWATSYDWRKEEERLNEFPQFLTRINGLDIHFMHVKPNLPLNRKELKVIPLLLVHGFPGSSASFSRLIPMLTTAHPSQDFVFEVICPSIPGYGFSQSPVKEELNGKDVARMFLALMNRLDVKEFYVLGCGWGCVVASLIGRCSPSRVKGIHVNMCFSLPMSFNSILRLAFMGIFPFLASKSERPIVRKMRENVKSYWNNTAFHDFIRTTPQSLGPTLSDSPTGLAACLLERFLKEKFENPIVPDKKIFGEATLNDLLTIVTICWINNNFIASATFYKNIQKDFTSISERRQPLTVPVGVSVFPEEGLIFPKVVLEQQIADLVSYTVMPRGGYMVSLEEPLLLANDFMKFVNLVERRQF